MYPSNATSLSLQWFNDKDIIDKNDKNNIVYKIDYMDCNKTYIGESKRKLKTRLIEHDKSIITQNLCSSLSIRTIENNHGHRRRLLDIRVGA